MAREGLSHLVPLLLFGCMLGVEGWFLFLLFIYQNWLKTPPGFSVQTNKGDYAQGTSQDDTSNVIAVGTKGACFSQPGSWKLCFQSGSGYKQADFGCIPLPPTFVGHVRLIHLQRVTTCISNGTKSCFLQTGLWGKPIMVSEMGEGGSK